MTDEETPDFEKITVETGEEPYLTEAFMGRWLVAPDPDETRSRLDGVDGGAYFGVALGQAGRYAVYTAHCNERWAASLHDYATLDEAVADGLPRDIASLAAAEMGIDRPLWRHV